MIYRLAVALLLLAAIPAAAQTYVPLQPAHAAAPWYQPEMSGEGLMLSVIEHDDGDAEIFGTIYLTEPHGWYSVQAGYAQSQTRNCPLDWSICHRLDLYRTESISDTWRFGWIWLRPNLESMEWIVMVSGGWTPMMLRDGTLFPLGPVRGVGVCDYSGFGPHLPQAADEWCDP